MSEQYQAMLAEWRHAVEQAREAEQALSDAFEAYTRNAGPAPTEQQYGLVRQRRAIAEQKLGAAMQYVKQVTGRA